MILKAILLGSLLFQSSMTNHHEPIHDRFHKAIEYWTETLCTLQQTKTMVFHGIFTNGTKILRDFFDVLLRTTTEYCNTVILLKTNDLSTVYRHENTNVVQRKDQEKVVDQMEEYGLKIEDTKMEEYTSRRDEIEMEEYGSKRQKIWRSTPVLNFLHHKWSIKRNWRKNDEYYIDIWTVNVVFIDDDDSFETVLKRWLALNGREHFIVLAVWRDALLKLRDARQMIDKTLRKLWSEQRVMNVIFNEPLSRRGFELYTYNPFAVNDEKSWGKLERVDTHCQRKLLRFLSTLHRIRTVDFHGYRLNVSMFDQGLEGMKIQGKIDPTSFYVHSGGYNWSSGILLGALAKRLNFKANVIEPNDGETYGYQTKNGTFTGAIGDLLRHRVEASFAFFFVKKYGKNTINMEFTATVGFDEVCVITPKAAKIPKGLRMYRIYELPVWLCIVLSNILIYLTWYYTQVFAPQRSKNIDGQRIVLHTLLSNTGYPIPSPNSSAERCLLAGVFISSVTIIGIFNGVLYTMFANDMRYKEIDTLKELDESGLPIGITSNSKDVFGYGDESNLPPIIRRLQKKMIRVPNNIEMAAIYRNVSGILRKQHYFLISEPLRDKNGVRMVHRMRNCPVKFHLACLLPTNSFLRERINTEISRLNQAGLPDLWRSRSVLEHALKMKFNPGNEHTHKKDNFEALQLNDLHICFVILAAGLLSSAIAFFNEMGWLRLNFKMLNSK